MVLYLLSLEFNGQLLNTGLLLLVYQRWKNRFTGLLIWLMCLPVMFIVHFLHMFSDEKFLPSRFPLGALK